MKQVKKDENKLIQFFLSHSTFILIVSLIIVGIFLRIFLLDKIPPGPNWDEASAGYNALTIARTGLDEWGTKLPTSFPAFGDYKNALHIYSTALVVKFFGLNLFTSRIFAALIGSSLIVIWYQISFSIFKKKSLSLMTALFVTFSPFGIFFSRIGDDGFIMSSFFISLGLLFEIFYIEKHKDRDFFLSILFFILAVFSYDVARIISPALILGIFIINFSAVKKSIRSFLGPLLLCAICFLILLSKTNIGAFQSLQYAGIFGDKKSMVLETQEFRQDDKNGLLSRILHNKATFSVIALGKNYLAHFGSDFLVNFKELDIVAESLYAPLHIVMLPFYYYGLFILLFELTRKKKRFAIILLIILALVVPIPSAITESAPDSHRYVGSIGITELIVALGLYEEYRHILVLKGKKWSNNLLIIFFAAYLLSTAFFLRSFFFLYPKSYGKIYASGEQLIGQTIKKNYSSYDRFIYSKNITLSPYIYPLYYLQFDPEKYWSTRKFSKRQDGWYSVDGFDKFIFPDKIDSSIITKRSKNTNKIMLFLSQSEITKLGEIKKYKGVKEVTSTRYVNLMTHSGEKEIYTITIAYENNQ